MENKKRIDEILQNAKEELKQVEREVFKDLEYLSKAVSKITEENQFSFLANFANDLRQYSNTVAAFKTTKQVKRGRGRPRKVK